MITQILAAIGVVTVIVAASFCLYVLFILAQEAWRARKMPATREAWNIAAIIPFIVMLVVVSRFFKDESKPK